MRPSRARADPPRDPAGRRTSRPRSPAPAGRPLPDCEPIRLEEDGESSPAPMSAIGSRRRLARMKKRLYFLLLVAGLLALAVAGWTVQGLRRVTPAFGS